MLKYLLYTTALCAADVPAHLILAKNCFACHAAAKMGGLRLDSRETALKVIVPGDPGKSRLLEAVEQTNPKLKMPPGRKLADADIAVLRAWIAAGAAYPAAPSQPNEKLWSLKPVAKPAGATIDSLIDRTLKAQSLHQVRPADRRSLLRRATFDLAGLPPTPSELDAFLADTAPGAFARVVDRLLASPRYGERWGRYWLDVARYSDDHLNSTMDEPYPNAWRYRDWVIDAVNRDLPYTTFVKAQIAGDLLGDPALVAGTGLYGLNPEFQDDRVDVTTRGFLGLTVACAQCHDHKFDPIPQKDYYAILAVFNSSDYHEYPLVPKAGSDHWDAQQKALKAAEKELEDYTKDQAKLLAATLSGDLANLEPETAERWKKYLARKPFDPALIPVVLKEKDAVDEANRKILGDDPNRNDLSQASLKSLSRDHYFLWRDLFDKKGVFNHASDLDKHLTGEPLAKLGALQTKAKELKAALPPRYAFLHTLRDKPKRAAQRVYLRGNRDTPGDSVEPHFLTALGDAQPFKNGSGRLELAEAIANPGNPLTARVMVNRIWQHHFGEALVRTTGNFGELGERPTHPELLDYLAARFVESDWSMKTLHREIMLSRVYQLAVANDAAGAAKDPDNRYLWRANRRRLDAEALRDSLLFVSGNLDLTLGGPAIKSGDDNRRRTVYAFVSRRKPDSLLALFDFPNPNSTSEGRLATNVPLQRLFFLNSSLIEKEAVLLAQRAKTIREAYLLLLGREPTAKEIQLGEAFLKDSTWPQYAQVLLSSNEFAYVN